MTQRHSSSRTPRAGRAGVVRERRAPVRGDLEVLQENEALRRKCRDLERMEEHYRTLFDSIDEGFCTIEIIFDDSGQPIDYRFLQVNAAFEKQTGLKAAVGKTMREFAPQHERHWFEIYGGVALTGEPIRFVNQAEALGRWYEAYAFRTGPAKARQVGIIFRDITASKRWDEELRRRGDQLRFVTDHAPVLIIHCDAEGRFKFVNAPYAARFGMKAKEIAGKTIREVVGARAYAAIRKHVEAALRGERVEFEERMPYEHRDPRWVHAVYVPEIGVDGQVNGFLAVIQDITERREAEEALRQSESRFRGLMEQAPFSVQIFTPDGKTVRVNRAWEELWGVTIEEIAEYNILEDPQVETLGVGDYIRRAFAGEAVEIPAIQYDPNKTIPNLTRHKDPVRWVAAVAYPLHDESGRIREVVLVHQDITHRRRAEQALAQAQQELQKHAMGLEQAVADRTSSLRDSVHELEGFSYSIAHDMRAPLRAMRAFASILQEEHAGQLDETGMAHLERIGSAAARLDHLIVDILDYSKIVRGELTLSSVNLHRLAREVISLYPQFDSSRTKITIAGPLPAVLGNHAALTQVFSNLLTNAVKFVEPGVQPNVRIRAEEMAGDPEFPNGSVKLWVEDNGIGIPEVARDKLFEIFTRFESADLYEGTGIGLAIVRKAVQRMNGKVGVESERGKGSRFWVQLHRPGEGASDPEQGKPGE